MPMAFAIGVCHWQFAIGNLKKHAQTNSKIAVINFQKVVF
jgi:hypothetical protein